MHFCLFTLLACHLPLDIQSGNILLNHGGCICERDLDFHIVAVTLLYQNVTNIFHILMTVSPMKSLVIAFALYGECSVREFYQIDGDVFAFVLAEFLH